MKRMIIAIASLIFLALAPGCIELRCDERERDRHPHFRNTTPNHERN